jgi:hypothetical protein
MNAATIKFIKLQSHGSKVLWSSNTHLANWYTSGAKITFPDYTDSLTTFCQLTSQSFSTTPSETSYDRDAKMIDMMKVRDTIISFLSIQDINWGPDDEVEGFGFIQEDFVQVMKNDYDLHQNLDQTAGVYQLDSYLEC